MKNKKNISANILNYIFLISMSVVFVLPMIFTILSSLKTKLEIFSSPFSLPKKVQWSNYIIAWKDANMSSYFLNSLIQSGLSVIITLIVASMAAYALARFSFKLNKLLIIVFLLGMMLPMHTVLVPISYIIGAFNLK